MVYNKHFLLAALLSTSVAVRAQDECVPCCTEMNAEQCVEQRADRKACPKDCPSECARNTEDCAKEECDRNVDDCAQEECMKRSCCGTRSEATAEEQSEAIQQEASIHLEAIVQVGDAQEKIEGNVIPGQGSLINVGKDLVFVAQVVPTDDAQVIDINVALFEKTEDGQQKEHGRCTARTGWGERAEIRCEASDLKLILTASRV